MVILRVRGTDGKVRSIPAIRGDDGKQMVVRFSAFLDGRDMSEEWDEERSYMGIAFISSTEAAPIDPNDYQWIKLGALSAGQYAEEGSAEKYLFYVGNGTDDGNRSNAMTVDGEGNMAISGELTLGEDGYNPREALKTEVAKLGATLAPMTRMVTGEVTGNGSNSISVELGFKPRIVMFTHSCRGGQTASGTSHNTKYYANTAIYTVTELILYLGHGENTYCKQIILGAYGIFNGVTIDVADNMYMSVGEFTVSDTGFTVNMFIPERIVKETISAKIYPYDPSPDSQTDETFKSSWYYVSDAINSDLGTRYYYTAIG